MTNWSPQQETALREVSAWLDDPGGKQLFRLFGFAGTGKTTLARHLAQHVRGEVRFAAYTGKAASVLIKSGCENAQTLHSLIYHPKRRSEERLNELKLERNGLRKMMRETPQPDWRQRWVDRAEALEGEIKAEERNADRPDFTLNLESPLREAALLVVDECSMVDETMAQDILSFGTPVLVLGDPAQLPPVRGTGYFTDAKPDIMLTEIHRQARDNPIIEMATMVRQGRALQLGSYGDSRVVNKTDPETAMRCDQILVGRNNTRHVINRRVRELHGWENPYPVAGDKVVCRRNDHDLGLLNGVLYNVTEDSRLVEPYMNLQIAPQDGGEELLITAHPEFFHGDPETIGRWDRMNAQEFHYGWALTVHVSQGSQWGEVMLMDEWTHAATRQRWLYTGITRAAERLTVVRRD